jgi:hypothetical protein
MTPYTELALLLPSSFRALLSQITTLMKNLLIAVSPSMRRKSPTDRLQALALQKLLSSE